MQYPSFHWLIKEYHHLQNVVLISLISALGLGKIIYNYLSANRCYTFDIQIMFRGHYVYRKFPEHVQEYRQCEFVMQRHYIVKKKLFCFRIYHYNNALWESILSITSNGGIWLVTLICIDNRPACMSWLYMNGSQRGVIERRQKKCRNGYINDNHQPLKTKIYISYCMLKNIPSIYISYIFIDLWP